jgi:hypothetical protein
MASHDVPSVTGKRWLHTLVVVGAAMTSGSGCRRLKASADAAQFSDTSVPTDADALADSSANSPASTETGGSQPAFDGGVEAGSDALADARVEFPLVLIP